MSAFQVDIFYVPTHAKIKELTSRGNFVRFSQKGKVRHKCCIIFKEQKVQRI